MGIGTGAALIGSAIVGGVASNRASKRAASTQARSGEQAINFQRESRDLARSDLAPFRDVGADAIPQINNLISGGFVDDQLFNTLNERSLPAISESRAAQGLFNSAGTRDALSDRLFENFVLAGPQLQGQKFNQLFNLLNLGQSSAAGQANTAVTTGQGIANTTTGIGNALAAGQIGQGNAISTGINQLATLAGQNPDLFSFQSQPFQPVAGRPLSGNALINQLPAQF